MCVFTLTVRV